MSTNPDTRPLPHGWVQQFDENHKAWFYVQKDAPGGPKSQWTHPAEDQPSSYAPPAGAPPPRTNYNGTPVNEKSHEWGNSGQNDEYTQARNDQYGSSSSPAPGGGYQQQPPPPQQQKKGGFLNKLKQKMESAGQPQPRYGQGYGGGGYQQHGMMGGGGYGQQGMMGGGYGQQPMMGGGYGQQGMMGGGMYGRPQRQGMGAGGAAALGVGGGLLGGMMIGNMISDGQNDAYQDGYEDGGGGDFDGGDMGGDF